MISPIAKYSKSVLKSGKRIIDYSVVSKEQDKFGMSATGYFAVLPVFWRQFYAMLMGVMRNYGVALVYLQTRLFLLGYRLNPRDSFVFSCGEYALSLDRDGAGEEFPWGLGCKNPWQDGSRTKISFKDFMEANEELTIMGLGMFIAVHPDESMFDGTCGIPRDKWLRELSEIWDKAGDVERNGIMRYAKFFKSSERLSEMEKYGAISPTAGVVVKAGVSTGERIDAAIKNMKDWTEEDFWNEMTELLAQSKAEKDSKQIMRIMEMKAKAMGLLKEDSKGTNFTLVMMQEQAKALIDKYNIADKRVVIDV